MRKYYIRLDDACPSMNILNWQRIEQLLDRYNVKPIVGVIPDNMDSTFNWVNDSDFWGIVKRWVDKSWIIAQHGLHHKYRFFSEKKTYFQKSHSNKTEWAGLSLVQQFHMIKEGYDTLVSHGIIPKCFFAPAHTYDANTVEAIRRFGRLEFVSDGYALKPYLKSGVFFLPSICDGPYPFPFGIFTFVFHPSVMSDNDFRRLDNFLSKHYPNICNTTDGLFETAKEQGVIGRSIEYSVYCLRGIRNKIKKNLKGSE